MSLSIGLIFLLLIGVMGGMAASTGDAYNILMINSAKRGDLDGVKKMYNLYFEEREGYIDLFYVHYAAKVASLGGYHDIVNFLNEKGAENYPCCNCVDKLLMFLLDLNL